MFDTLSVTFPVAGVETYVFIPPLVAFTISFFTSMAGISGAFLILPFQVSVLGFTNPSASATNFLYNVIGTPGGVYRYTRESRQVWPLALTIISGLLPGVLAGYYVRILYLPDPQTFKLFVGLVLLFVGFRLVQDLLARRKRPAGPEPVSAAIVTSSKFGLWRTRFEFCGREYTYRTPLMLLLGFAVGIIGGIYGIGGGAIIAPLCITWFGLPIRAIAGSVLLGTFITSLAGVLIYSLLPVNGVVAPPDLALGVLFGLGGLIGTYTGARMQKYMPETWIRIVLGIVIFTVALRYILKFFM